MFAIVFQQVLIMFLLMLAGFVYAKLAKMKKEECNRLCNILLMIVTPCLLLSNLQRPFNKEILQELLFSLGLAVFASLLAVAVAYLLISPKKQGENGRMERYGASFGNVGFIGIPLITGIFGAEYAVFAVVFVVVFHVLSWTLGVGMLKGSFREVSWREAILNPGVLSALVAVPLFVLNNTKQELLNGQNFNPTAVTEQLSIMVLSYDSFRGRGKEGLKAYQENSNLAAFAKVLGTPENPIEKADETALFQVINQLNPLVVVDESHHARSELSIEMLANFNPCFVLDLTATPKKRSNIISYVDAVQLKAEHMVKLPVIVYNRGSQAEVLMDTIDLRDKLEEIAAAEYQNGGKYIRPIALFQAQPKGKEDATTFEKLRAELVNTGIPAEHIAIRTADVNELKNVDLLSPDCPVRYIITVNALKEGWDCPFAYILASLANKTSQVDVEQILGRILRLPYTAEHRAKALNMSYVLTSSNDFNDTVQQIIRGLNSAGFSDRDYRLAEPVEPAKPAPVPEQLPIIEPEAPQEDFAELDGKSIGAELQRRRESENSPESAPKADSMLAEAQQAGDAYNQAVQGADNDPFAAALPWEVRGKVNTFHIIPQYRESVDGLLIPQFFQVIPQSLFTDGDKVLLSKEQLADGFTLKGKAYDIDFAAADDEIVKVDVETGRSVPRAYQMEAADQRYFKEYFSSLPPESRVRQCKDMMIHQLDKLNMVDGGDLRAYVKGFRDPYVQKQRTEGL